MEMKQVKIQDIQGKALDYLVAKCEGATDEWRNNGPFLWDGWPCIREGAHDVCFKPSTNWANGGPIIERVQISLDQFKGQPCRAYLGTPAKYMHAMFATEGDPLIAAMRCYVASKMGDVVEVPASLL